jgi:hypothetical protein
MIEVRLGDKVRDRVTGYSGIATSRTEFLNGCIQIEITPKLKKVNGGIKPEDLAVGMAIDEGQLERVGPGINKEAPVKKSRSGGPMRKVPRRIY